MSCVVLCCRKEEWTRSKISSRRISLIAVKNWGTHHFSFSFLEGRGDERAFFALQDCHYATNLSFLCILLPVFRDLLKNQDLKLACGVYYRAKAHEPTVTCFLLMGRLDQVIPYAQRFEYLVFSLFAVLPHLLVS